MRMFNVRAALLAAGLAVAAMPALAADEKPGAPKLPSSMVWATYDVGSSGFVEASAIADAFGKTYGTRVRLMPSGTSIARLLPLKTGRAQYGWLADELYFATEGTYDFAAADWGPQDLRVLAGRPSTFGLATAANSGIATVAEVKGKRVPRIKANPSINIKVEAMLAFGGLSWDDVKVVEVPSYGAALQALVDGQVDVAGTTPTAAALYELESQRGIAWVPLPKDNAAGWKAITSVADFFAPVTATAGAGLSPQKPAELFAVRYPMISVYANATDDDVYQFLKALDQTYGLYQGATSAMPAWRMSEAGTAPSDAPFHPGAVRYLKEIGVWTDKDEAWNVRRMARLKSVQAAWTTARALAAEKKVADADWPTFWDAYRKQNLN